LSKLHPAPRGSGVLIIMGAIALAAGGAVLPAPAAGQPLLDVEPAALEIALEPGGSALVPLHVANLGEAGSLLVWAAAVDDPFLPGGRNIDGSSFTADPPDYQPGQTRQFTLSVTNASLDYDWLDGITLDFPPGANVLASTHFLGGTGGLLATTYATGDGALVRWIDANGGWGNVYGGETVTATVTVAFSPDLYGSLGLPWTMSGDGYGGPPHDITGKLVLAGPWGPGLDLLVPNGGEVWVPGESRQILWSNWGGVYAVDLSLSRDGGLNWEPMVAGHPAGLPFNWVVTGPLSADCRVRVEDVGDACQDESAASFHIHRPIDWLAIAEPAGGELAAGEVDTLWILVDTAGLPPGADQLAGLRFSSNDPAGDLLVPVTLHLGATAAPDAPPSPEAPRLEAWPNPFNPSTRLVFQLAAPGRARLELLDLQGRRLRLLTEGQWPAGEQVLAWDGRDEAGRPLPSGVYLARLISAQGRATRKLLLMK